MVPTKANRTLRVALLGCGVVGSQVAQQLRERRDELSRSIGAPLDLIGAAVRDTTKPRPGIDPTLVTTDAEGLVDRADIVIELMGGIEPARSLILRALRAGKAVVTANKALLAEDGPTLYQAATDSGADLYYEAAVAGAIPLVRPIAESLSGDTIDKVIGIVNGTTNYILDKMTTEGRPFDEVLALAQAKGYAEADPTADVEGFDAAAKCAILASLAFHTRVAIGDVYREGIEAITADDVAWAARTGHVIKLLAIAERVDGGLVARVHPALISQRHPLASVRGAFNAVFVQARSAGELMFYGRGAGGIPTSSAVMGDLVTVARNTLTGGRGPGESDYEAIKILQIGDAVTRYQVRLRVADRPGVLAAISQAFADQGVSIETMRQTQLADAPGEAAAAPQGETGQLAGGPDGQADLLIGSHPATDRALAATMQQVATLDVVEKILSVLRVEGE